MASALVLLAEGFEEIEAVTVVDVLRRAGVTVALAGRGIGPVRGAHHISVTADTSWLDLEPNAFDAVVLPGGMPGAKNLREDESVIELVRKFAAQGKTVAAICAAPIVLEAASILENVRATSYPGFTLPSARYVEDAVVQDGSIVTSRGPGTALDFAFALVERLVGADAAREHKKRMLFSDRPPN